MRKGDERDQCQGDNLVPTEEKSHTKKSVCVSLVFVCVNVWKCEFVYELQ